MPHNYMSWPLSIFCIVEIHRLGRGLNPQTWVQKVSDKPTKPSVGYRHLSFEQWSSDEDETRAGTTSPNSHTTLTGGRLSLDVFKVQQLILHDWTSAMLGLNSWHAGH
ncbi:hypothetical protein TNCV_3275251 [Trichonephila clavipes]|nr:hypothetical protein TNCV_3275251 [Trichonephila clavipes]